MMWHRFSGKILGGLKQKHKKQPFSDASASHLSLVLWQSDFKQMLESATPQHQRRPPQ